MVIQSSSPLPLLTLHFHSQEDISHHSLCHFAYFILHIFVYLCVFITSVLFFGLSLFSWDSVRKSSPNALQHPICIIELTILLCVWNSTSYVFSLKNRAIVTHHFLNSVDHIRTMGLKRLHY